MKNSEPPKLQFRKRASGGGPFAKPSEMTRLISLQGTESVASGVNNSDSGRLCSSLSGSRESGRVWQKRVRPLSRVHGNSTAN